MSDSRPMVIVDCETTSLTPDYETGSGVIWELALLWPGNGRNGIEHLWRMKPDLAVADPAALAVGRYYERTRGMCGCLPVRACDLANLLPGDDTEWSLPSEVAAEVARLLDGAIIVAANPAFDAGFLAAFLRAHGEAPTWHYRLRDIGSMAWAWLQAHHLPHHLDTPAIDAGTDDLAGAMGIDPAAFERHSALGDCRLVAAMLARIQDGAA